MYYTGDDEGKSYSAFCKHAQIQATLYLQPPRQLLYFTVFSPQRSRKINTAERFIRLVLEQQLYSPGAGPV